MSECGWLSDRMPAVALGRGQWTPQEAQHLTLCGGCQREWELVRVANRLGTLAADALEPAAVAGVVSARIERDRQARVRRKGWTFGGLAAAAAVLIAVWTGAVPNEPSSGIPDASLAASQLEIPLPELDSLQPAELDSVLQTMDEAAAGSSSVDPELGDLNPDELERVLDSWEG
jgi:hypothetical protein